MLKRCVWCLRDERPAEIRMHGAVHWCRECAVTKGGTLGRRAVALHDIQASGEGFTPAVLKQLAESGIMDANALFLPAGRLSKAEADARERAQVEELAC